MADLSEATVAGIERGLISPSWLQIVRITGALDIRLGPPFDGIEWSKSKMSLTVQQTR
jgi:hypothetical protein